MTEWRWYASAASRSVCAVTEAVWQLHIRCWEETRPLAREPANRFIFFCFFVVWICIGRREEGRLNVVECTVGTLVWLWKWKLWCPVWRLLWASFHLFKVGNSVGLVVVASAGVWGNYSSERGRSWDALIFHIVAIVVVVKFIHRITTWINLDGYSADSLNKNLSVVGFDTFLMENNRWMTGNSSFFFFETRI